MEKKKNEISITNGDVKEQVALIISQEKEKRDALLKSLQKDKGKDIRLRRDAFQSLDEKGMLDAVTIMDEYELIKAKQSNLSSSERAAVGEIMLQAVDNAFYKKAQEIKAKHKKEEKAKAEPQKRARKPRNKKEETTDASES